MAPHRINDNTAHDIRVRVAELEARVRWLEGKLKKVALAAKVKPEPVIKGAMRARCPSCFAQVPRGKRGQNCVYCGFSFDVVAPVRPRRAR